MIKIKSYRINDIEKRIDSTNLLMPLDVLLVGATGLGKNSTLNAIFGYMVAKVGDGANPETQNISPHKLYDFLRIHDPAGLGYEKIADIEHSKILPLCCCVHALLMGILMDILTLLSFCSTEVLVI